MTLLFFRQTRKTGFSYGFTLAPPVTKSNTRARISTENVSGLVSKWLISASLHQRNEPVNYEHSQLTFIHIVQTRACTWTKTTAFYTGVKSRLLAWDSPCCFYRSRTNCSTEPCFVNTLSTSAKKRWWHLSPVSAIVLLSGVGSVGVSHWLQCNLTARWR